MDGLLHDMHAAVAVDGGTPWVVALLLTTLAATIAIYLRGWLRVRRIVPALRSPWRPLAFVAGLLALWVAVGSPLARMHHQWLVAHMLQHLLLSLCAAPLILLGAPFVPLREGIGGRSRRPRVIALVRLPPSTVARTLDDPVICWSVAMLVFVGWHFPSIFDMAWRSAGLHLLACATFFGSGLLFWWPVIEPWPNQSRLSPWSTVLYLFGATLPCDVLSAFLAFSDRVVYPVYTSAWPATSMGALHDQAAAGALMWFCVTFAYGVPAAVIVLRWLSPQRSPQQLSPTAQV